MATELVEPGRRRRVTTLIIGFALVELGLLVIAYLSPALRVLIRPVYVIVAVAFLLAIHTATRPRAGDRRHGDRRSSEP